MLKVMLIEDEPLAMKHCIKCLEKCGPSVNVIASCRNRAEVLDAYSKAVPDVIFADIRLGNDDGLNILRELRELGWNGKLIIMSVYKNFEYAIKAIHLDVEDYLLKPIFQEDVSRIMEKLILESEKHEESVEQIILGQDRSAYPHYIVKALEYISLNYMRSISLNEIAQFSAVSPSYLSAGFKRHTGATFVEYLNMYRLEVSKDILKNQTIPLNQAAEMVGISDVVYYNKLFKRYVGVSPGRFRTGFSSSDSGKKELR